MPVAAVVRARCRALLPPGEEICYVLPALSVGSPGMATFLIVVTDLSVLVLSTKFFDRDAPTSVYAAHPRRTRLGPVEFSEGACIELGGMAFEIEEEYVAVVCAADAEVFAPETLPCDPLPDL
ncbi:hypothetical protein FHS43_004103 [Streptosporangium becharense]|uniref:Uncharacterized protein n=1 Tax=Streptosporangium becharense TaxID=1816182 RepID=A0A7W9MEV5_9ACTN|nr:hypothetical protein [Streptosporangium becharense]MBB2912808.1 hypothetical protein [Streptosporangium becharense]MBB5818367.1 hypothetical protein [Streptosporangium becharense]